MNHIIKIIFLSLSINLFYAQSALAQSKVFNNVFNDYSYTKQAPSGEFLYNSEYINTIFEFDSGKYTIYSHGNNHDYFPWEDSLLSYSYVIDIDEFGDTISTSTLNLDKNRIEATFSGMKINGNEYIIGINNDNISSVYSNDISTFIKLNSNRDTIFRKAFDYGEDTEFVTIKTNDNGATFQVLGFADVDTAGINYDAFISTIDSNGNLISNIQLGGVFGDFLYALEYLDNGNYLLCGHTYSYSTGGGADIWLIEIQPNGTVVWQKTFGNQYGDRINNSKGMIIKDNNIYIAGRSGEVYPNIAPSVVGYLIKTDMQGNSLWEKRFVKGDENDDFKGLQSFDDKTFIIGGQTNSYIDTAKYPIGWILKVDTNGNTIWERTVQKYTPADNAGDEPHHYVADMLVSSDKGILLGGYIIANYITDNLGYYHRNDAWLAKTDSCGYTVGDIPEPFFVIDSIKHAKESHTVHISEQSQNYCTAEIDWGDGSENEFYYAYVNNMPLAEKQFQHNYTQDGSYTIKTTTLAGEEFRSYEVTVDIVGVGIESVIFAQSGISLFPNPGNDYVVIQNQHTPTASQEGDVRKQFSASVYDLNGKLIKSFNLNSKLYQQKVDVSGLVNGVYFLKFSIGNEVVGNEKMIIIR